MTRSKSTTAAILSLAFLATSAQANPGADPFEKFPEEMQVRMNAIAQSWVKDGLLSEQKHVTVGAFEYVNSPKVKTGLTVSHQLKSALEMHKFIVSDNAQCIISGKYETIDDGNELIVNINFVFADIKGQPLQQIEQMLQIKNIEVKRPDEIGALAGVNVSLKGNAVERKKQLREQMSEPAVAVQPGVVQNGQANPNGELPNGTIVRAKKDSKYGIEIQVFDEKLKEYMPRAVTTKDGVAQIVFKKGDVYRIRLINDSDDAAAVEVKLDGLNIFNLAQNRKFHDARQIIDAKNQGHPNNFLVAAWFRRQGIEGANKLEIGSLADAVAAANLPPGKAEIGLITVTFSRAWDSKQPPPPDVQFGRNAGGGIANVLGQPVKGEITLVDYDWSDTDEVIHIRYDLAPGNLPN